MTRLPEIYGESTGEFNSNEHSLLKTNQVPTREGCWIFTRLLFATLNTSQGRFAFGQSGPVRSRGEGSEASRRPGGRPVRPVRSPTQTFTPPRGKLSKLTSCGEDNSDLIIACVLRTPYLFDLKFTLSPRSCNLLIPQTAHSGAFGLVNRLTDSCL